MPGGGSGGFNGDRGPGGVDPGDTTFGCVAGDGPAGATGAIGGPDAGCVAPVGGAINVGGVINAGVVRAGVARGGAGRGR